MSRPPFRSGSALPRFASFVVVVTCFVFPGSGPVAAAAEEGGRAFPAVKLRGYGTLSGEWAAVPGTPGASALTVTCESERKAQLLLAKFLSDLQLLPGVSPLPLSTKRGPVAARMVEGQGAIAAVRAGKRVFVFAAPGAKALSDLYASRLPAEVKPDATEAEVAVPMYLDRWDKYGFRFYYGPFVKPQLPDHRDDENYDPRQDFVFAEKNGHSGLVLWNVPARGDTSEGIMDLNSREWVYREAQRRKLPLGINIGIEDSNFPLANRYPGDMVPFADQYLGGWYGALNMGGRTVAWGSSPVQEVALGQVQQLVRNLGSRYDNIVNWLEPHEELSHGNCDILDDHGPASRESFLSFLHSKYGTPQAVAKRWGGADEVYKSWDDVPFPEVASFFGWGKDAFDLTGVWKISYDADYGAASADPKLDDSAWAPLQAPGHSIVRALPRKPAVFRRHFKIDPAWRAAHPKVWLYVWDLNPTSPRDDQPTSKTDVLVYMNGKAFPDNPPHRLETHWSAVDVTAALTEGDNVLTVCLPQAILDYRVYLAGEGPGVYPDFGPGRNAEWADFADWCVWSRGQAVRRGAQMIRQVDPDRPITLMSPGDYEGPIKAVAEDYGGVFHDTGGMAGFWTDEPCLMMQSSGLPNDCEPGSGAADLPDFKRFMGRWSTEATQGVDYFQHVGDVLWKPQVKEYFEQTQNLWHLIGKYHVPQPEVAILESDRNRRLFGFPWNLYDHQSSSPNLILANGYYAWGLQSKLLNICPRSTILEEDFGRGNVDAYRVVIDSNSTILEPEVVDQIEKWVRAGGTFVTYKQTGRHTSVLRDSWPIAKLTGYAVTGMDPLAMDGGALTHRKLHPAEGQSVFHSDGPGWNDVQESSGLSLKKQDPACEDLLVWEDGSVAAGLRHLGKGAVIDLGTSSADPLVFQILDRAKVKRVPGGVDGKFANDVVCRQFVTNNGLYDVWVLWNQKDKPLTVDLKFRDGYKPAACREVSGGKSVPVSTEGDAASLAGLKLEPYETRAFLVPRNVLATAPADWLALQRNWWKGTADPGPALPAYKPRLALDLTEDCAFKTLPDPPANANPPEDAAPADPTLDDSSWPRLSIGVFDLPDHQDSHHAIFRKRFTVPAEWDHGRVTMFTHGDDLDSSRKFLDGKPVHADDTNDELGGVLKPGSTHLLAVELWGSHFPVGTRTPVWISYHPDPISTRPVEGPWTFAKDYLRFDTPAEAGKPLTSEGALRGVVRVDSKSAGHNLVLHARSSDTSLRALIFNGHWVNANGNIYRNLDVNVTPWVKFGEDNEVVLVTGKTTLKEVTLEEYDSKQYP